ncbi:MAG: DNA helicase [Lachnospiraceae bacterium]|nr:DNA helicase [Lachnospiraceae bacterium]
MAKEGGAISLFNTIKTIVTNYLRSRKLADVLIGTYTGSSIMVNENLPLPMSMIRGNLKNVLTVGDKVWLLRGDGGNEYYILEIIGKRFAFYEEVR